MEKYKNAKTYRISRVGMDKKSIQKSFKNNLLCTLAKDKYTATSSDNYMALAIAIRDRMVKRWIATQQRYHRQNKKRVYYFSMEFLIGRLLGNNIINLGIWDEVNKALEELGLDLEDLREQEFDAGLGNGGLGRLAACFLDSMATLSIPAHGYGIRYDYGIFHQKISQGRQIELPDEWLKFGCPWEFPRPEYAVKINFYGNVETYQENGKTLKRWVNTEDVLAVPFDIPIIGYKNNIVNTLRLWSGRSTEEFDFNYFNHGDYEKAVDDKIFSENISKVLYPNDNIIQGKELRLKQEYFFTAASLSDILRRFREENSNYWDLPKRAAIQLNDTHPALAIVELMRLLIDVYGLEWQEAWSVTTKVFAYTNHTIMPEALEAWPVSMLGRVLPRHLEIIYEINSWLLERIRHKFPHSDEKIQRMSLIEEGEDKKVRMANLCIVGGHSINGVSELHSELIKTTLFKDFYEMCPQKFNNKTNGVTQRRWLLKANPGLAHLITKNIGDQWITNLSHLAKLLNFKDDKAFKENWKKVKLQNKKNFAEYVLNFTGIAINPHSLFDVQVKRMHEYKRQLLFAIYIISEYLRIKNNRQDDITPRTFIVSGKAAPGYFMAKLIIKFINNIAQVVNQDEVASDKMKVLFLENYRVTLAEKIFPASDLSEQISTAGTEASGTGCMKFMINGALTIGTLDGANIEIAKEIGEENIFTFGLRVDEINDLRNRGYNPNHFIAENPLLKEAVELIRNNFFSKHEADIFKPILEYLTGHDHYLICADFNSYLIKQQEAAALYRNQESWLEKSIINVAKSGKFSSDRAIQEYAREIWHVPSKVK